MELTEHEQHFKDFLDRPFFEEIVAYRRQKLVQLAGILQEIRARVFSTENTSEALEYVAEAIKLLRKYLRPDAPQELGRVLVRMVEHLHGEVPETLTISQSDSRFSRLDEDTWYVSTAKAGKRLSRRLGKKTWNQKIPLRRVVAWHFYDAENLFTTWIDEDEDLITGIILELEQVLIHQPEWGPSADTSSGLQQLMEVLLNQIETHRSELKAETDVDGKNFKTSLLEAIAKVGTVEQRAGFYSENRLLQKQEQTLKQLHDYQQRWQDVNLELLEKTWQIYQFLVFCSQLDAATETYLKNIKCFADHFLKTPLKRLQKELYAAKEMIEEPAPGELLNIENLRSRLSLQVESDILNPLDEQLSDNPIEKYAHAFYEKVLQQASDVEENVLFVAHFDREKKPPALKTKRVAWRNLVLQGVKKQVLQELHPKGEIGKASLQKQYQQLEEIKEVIVVNLESVSPSGQENEQAAHSQEIAIDGLQRTEAKAKSIFNEALKLQEELCEPVQTGLAAFRKNMFALLYRTDAKALAVLDAKYKASEKKYSWETKLRARWARFQDKVSVVSRFVWKKSRHYYDLGATTLGFKKDEHADTQKADVAAYLSETAQRTQALPYIYQRLFDFKAEPDERYLVGLNEPITRLKDAYAHWQKGLSATVAVVGEKGSGKSTFLQFAKTQLFADRDIIQITIEESLCTQGKLLEAFREHLSEASFETTDELIAVLKEEQKQRMIILEGIQHVYLRNLNGYEAIEQLIYLIAETSETVFWMVGCSRYAWAYLNKGFNLGDYFSHTLKTDALDEQQIQKVIMNRHRASGYDLVFASSEKDLKTRSYRVLLDDEEKAQAYLRDKYFSKLAKLAGGNASVAMIFWIRSIQKFDANHCFIAPLEAASLKMLEDLKPKTLFILAALVLHDSLLPAALASTQNLSPDESRIILKRLQARGMVTEHEHGFILNHLIYRQAIEELKERNILHIN